MPFPWRIFAQTPFLLGCLLLLRLVVRLLLLGTFKALLSLDLLTDNSAYTDGIPITAI